MINKTTVECSLSFSRINSFSKINIGKMNSYAFSILRYKHDNFNDYSQKSHDCHIEIVMYLI